MKGFLPGLVVVLSVCATTADAAWRIGLRALSSDGSHAVLSYNALWLEVELATGQAELIVPTESCSWSSAAYAPSGGDMALTANCSISLECTAARSSLFTKPAGGPIHHVITKKGRRWNEAFWHRSRWGDEIFVRETRLFTPLALGLSDLRSQDDECAQAPATFTAIATDDGRQTAQDYLPRGWTAVSIVAALDGHLVATLRARPNGQGNFLAETELATICADDDGTDWRRSVCGTQGQEMRFEWQDADWTFYDRADTVTPLRRFLSADLTVTADEYCEGAQVDGHLQTSCLVVVNAPWGRREIEAPAGLFGDLALSADGTALMSLAVGRGFTFRRFDMFDTRTGEETSLEHLLEFRPPWLGGPTP